MLTRLDGDGRGGAALSMRAITGKPIKLVGVGERMDQLEEFYPERIANRILGMGDIVSLVEKASETIDAEKANRIADKMRKGQFDLDDLSEQLQQMQKIGGMSGVLGMLPGIGKMKKQLDGANMDDSILKRQQAIISSMTKQERRKPEILKASRKKRVAAGSGTKVEEVNKLLKMHRQMADVMKMMGGKKGKGAMAKLFGGMGGGMGGGMPQPSPEMMQQMQQMGGGKGQMPDLSKLQGGGGQGLPPGLPGMGGGLPGLPGMPKGPQKKK